MVFLWSIQITVLCTQPVWRCIVDFLVHKINYFSRPVRQQMQSVKLKMQKQMGSPTPLPLWINMMVFMHKPLHSFHMMIQCQLIKSLSRHNIIWLGLLAKCKWFQVYRHCYVRNVKFNLNVHFKIIILYSIINCVKMKCPTIKKVNYEHSYIMGKHISISKKL